MSSTGNSGEDAAPSVSMHWFRKALRLHDNPALLASLRAARNGGRVYPVYVLDGDCYQLRRCSALRANFLVECLADLDTSLRSCGSRLYVASGDPACVLPRMWEEMGVDHLTFEADETGEPYAQERDARVRDLATAAGVRVDVSSSATLFGLADYVEKGGGNPAHIPGTMSAFQKAFGRMGPVPEPRAAPCHGDFPVDPDGEAHADRWLPPERPTDLPWPRNLAREDVEPIWGPEDCRNLRPIARGGETAALVRLKKAVTARPAYVASYEKPATSCTALDPSTTALSPYLSVGALSPRTFWQAIEEAVARAPSGCPRSKPPVSLKGQLLWRDFNHLIAHGANRQNPGSWGKMEGNSYCREVPWSDDSELLAAWREGRTGYPWIDACQRQLETQGWIHHLGRHAVACFLTRGDLWQSWERGQEHFEGQLLDADYALNGFNWLWLSCSGFFYMYFRCYSPVAFQQKKDKSGIYIRTWLPELAKLPDKYIYEPWKAPLAVLKAADVKLGTTYPRPICDHKVVSKENMEKMSYAYDLHKEKEVALKKGLKKSAAGNKAEKSETRPKKKVKRQTKLQ